MAITADAHVAGGDAQHLAAVAVEHGVFGEEAANLIDVAGRNFERIHRIFTMVDIFVWLMGGCTILAGVVGVSLVVLTGWAGQISLGHGAFMAFGAYTTAILNANYGVGEYWTIPIAGTTKLAWSRA